MGLHETVQIIHLIISVQFILRRTGTMIMRLRWSVITNEDRKEYVIGHTESEMFFTIIYPFLKVSQKLVCFSYRRNLHTILAGKESISFRSLFCLISTLWSQDSSVSIVSRLRVGRPEFDFR
jgi:hypothetical protein